MTWKQIVRSIEQVKGQKWEQFCQTYGDWGRGAAPWLGRKRGGLTLTRLGQLAGGVDYAAVAQAVTRFEQRLERQRALRESLAQIDHELSKV